MPVEQDYDFLFKTVIVGDSNVGKTQILSRFIDNQFSLDSKPTVGVEFGTKTVKIGQNWVKNQIWDTAGQQKFRALTSAYYRGAVGAIVVFDLTKNVTFQHISQWIKQVRQFSQPDVCILMVGNKNDLPQHQVRQQDIENYATDHKLLYVSTSAATGENVQLAFQTLIKQIMGVVDTQPQKSSDLSQDEQDNNAPKNQEKQKSNQIVEKQKNNSSQKDENDNKKPIKRQKHRIQAFSIEDGKKGTKQKNIKIGKQKSKTSAEKKKCC